MKGHRTTRTTPPNIYEIIFGMNALHGSKAVDFHHLLATSLLSRKLEMLSDSRSMCSLSCYMGLANRKRPPLLLESFKLTPTHLYFMSWETLSAYRQDTRGHVDEKPEVVQVITNFGRLTITLRGTYFKAGRVRASRKAVEETTIYCQEKMATTRNCE